MIMKLHPLPLHNGGSSISRMERDRLDSGSLLRPPLSQSCFAEYWGGNGGMTDL